MSNTRSVYDFLNHGLHENPDLAGMDYESASEAMPRLYGVSFGNGNDGVSHTYANFYVRTCEPYTLAAAAVLSDFKPGEGIVFAIKNIEIDGEADYGISATILDPPVDEMDPTGEGLPDPDDSFDPDDSWSSHNGAWLICEVFPVEPDDARDSVPYYESLSDAFTPDLITLAREV